MMEDAHDNALDDKAIAEKLAEKTSAWTDAERESRTDTSSVVVAPTIETGKASIKVPLPQEGDKFPLRGFQWEVMDVQTQPGAPFVAILLRPVGPTKAVRKLIRGQA